MSSQDFPTYGREPEREQPSTEQPSAVQPSAVQPSEGQQYVAPPAPYGGGTYGHGGQPLPPPYAPPPQSYGSQPGQYGGPPTDPAQPPSYRPGHPYGAPVDQHPDHFPQYGRKEPFPGRDPRAAKVLLLATLIAAFYGLLVISIQRVSIREITQAPGSPLNHPLRTDVIDALGQLLILLVGVVALVLWARDVLGRRKLGRQPAAAEIGGGALVAVSLIPLLIWFVMVLTTGLGSADDTLDRLPTAYGWGGFGLLILAAGLFLGYRELKPEYDSVVRAAPGRAPWE
ncbi:hypothetical protein E1263_25785 [Kribbella antibiotica]|uniref:DUF5671 domain-containing protein n=1 Tax=Kribbella antibiotica TaxID=190195 RepID=A0A4R4ZH45_9ACTN|nr:hypothetical protein [Kribbella antibiotica]TDD55892.1 hypothetical protein E1263_25785 [Kribbella antibiotica]